MNAHTIKRLSISSTPSTSNKLNEIKKALKSENRPYKGRISDAIIINSLIEILYQKKDQIKNVSGNDKVKEELERCLIRRVV